MSNTDLILEENAQETMIVQPTIQPQQIERGKFRSLTMNWSPRFRVVMVRVNQPRWRVLSLP